MIEDLVIFGTGGHAGVIVDIIETCYKHNKITGFIKSECSNHEIGKYYRGYPILGTLDTIKHHKNLNFIIAIGDNYTREKIYNQIIKVIPHAKFPTIIHNSAIISKSVNIVEGTVIGPGVIINTYCKVGKFCIINTGVIIEHDCQLADFVNLATGVKLGGTVKISKGSFIGMGATIIHKISIGENNVIGAGSVVVESYPNNLLKIYGVPAKIKSIRNIDDIYL